MGTINNLPIQTVESQLTGENIKQSLTFADDLRKLKTASQIDEAVKLIQEFNSSVGVKGVGQKTLVKEPNYLSVLLMHKIVTGQSNAFGSQSFILSPSGSTPVKGDTADPIYGDVFSPQGSTPYSSYVYQMFGSDTNLRELYESISTATNGDEINGSGETMRSGWANGMQRWLSANHYIRSRLIATVHAVGGANYSGLKKGTATYQQALNRVTAAKGAADSAGYGYEVNSISIIHGESEVGATAQGYADILLEWWSDYNDDVKLITNQERDIACFVIGLSTFNDATENVPLGQLKAHEDYPAIIYTTPSYIFPYMDEYHRLAEGAVKHGEYEMRAERFWMQGKKWSPLMPLSVNINGNIINITLNNEVNGTDSYAGPVGPLSIDTSYITDPGNYGFRCTDANVTITNVSLGSDKKTILITLDSSPEVGAKITYAMQSDLRNSSNPPDRYERWKFAGARGNIRDNDTRDKSAFDGQNLYNWLVPFSKEILTNTTTNETPDNPTVEPDVPSGGNLNQSESVIALRNDITCWPDISSEGVNANNDGFLDKLNARVYNLNGDSSASSHLTTGSDGKKGYEVASTTHAVIGEIDTSNSFTLGFVSRKGVSVGSYSTNANGWSIYHDFGSGKLRVFFGGRLITFNDYSGPSFTANPEQWHTVVMIVDYATNKVALRVDGALAGESIGSIGASLSDIAFGIFNVTGTQDLRANIFRSPIVISNALSGQELTDLENMLADYT